MKRSRIFCILAVIIITAISAPSYSADSYGKNLYRSFSKRLGKTRSAYPNLTDEQFANFRMVKTSGIAEGKLFRSSSPVSTWSERYTFSDSAVKNAGVKTIINLADSDEKMRKHEGYSRSYYSRQSIICLNLGMKYKSKDFRRRLAHGIHFMAVNEPPYLIHCSLGKDRAGFVCALIECFMDASLEEIGRDYMTSFYNYFGVIPGTKEYDFVLRNEIYAFLSSNLGAENLLAVNLPEYAEKYLLAIGVSKADLDIIRRKLGE